MLEKLVQFAKENHGKVTMSAQGATYHALSPFARLEPGVYHLHDINVTPVKIDAMVDSANQRSLSVLSTFTVHYPKSQDRQMSLEIDKKVSK